MDVILKKVNAVETKDDFIEFVLLLANDLKMNPVEWENKSLPTYLEAIASWTEDMDGYYNNMRLPIPANADWKLFANILVAAKMYE
jgi:hypothetical protein